VFHNFVFFPGGAIGRAYHALDQRVVPFLLGNRMLAKAATFGRR
jgi:hypothetical protein